MIIKKIDAISCGKVLGTIYAMLGFLVGVFFSLSAFGTLLAANQDGDFIPALSVGLGAFIVFPILYGLLGLLGGMFFAFLYNVVASFVGGIKIDLLQA